VKIHYVILHRLESLFSHAVIRCTYTGRTLEAIQHSKLPVRKQVAEARIFFKVERDVRVCSFGKFEFLIIESLGKDSR